MTRHAFTVDEANALVPDLESMFRDIRAWRESIVDTARKIEVLELLWGSAVRDASNPDHAEFVRLREHVERAMRSIQHAIEQRVLARGMRFPAGGIENGLVDFPTTYKGRWVYLCWHVGEPDVRFWHETDAGFQGRREITRAERIEMGAQGASEVDDSNLDF